MEERTWERLWPPELPYDYSAMNLEKALTLKASAYQLDGVKIFKNYRVTGENPGWRS